MDIKNMTEETNDLLESGLTGVVMRIQSGGVIARQPIDELERER